MFVWVAVVVFFKINRSSKSDNFTFILSAMPLTSRLDGLKSLCIICMSWSAFNPSDACITMLALLEKINNSSSFQIDSNWLTLWITSPSINNSQYSNAKQDGRKLYPKHCTTFWWLIEISFSAIRIVFFLFKGFLNSFSARTLFCLSYL